MASWRPATAGDPDGADEWRFLPLEDLDAAAADVFIDRFTRGWLPAAGLPESRAPEVPDTVELVVASSWEASDGPYVLRLRSWYTGETRWLYDWDGSVESALEWVDMVADLCGAWVRDERRYHSHRTVWDE